MGPGAVVVVNALGPRPVDTTPAMVVEVVRAGRLVVGAGAVVGGAGWARSSRPPPRSANRSTAARATARTRMARPLRSRRSRLGIRARSRPAAGRGPVGHRAVHVAELRCPVATLPAGRAGRASQGQDIHPVLGVVAVAGADPGWVDPDRGEAAARRPGGDLAHARPGGTERALGGHGPEAAGGMGVAGADDVVVEVVEEQPRLVHRRVVGEERRAPALVMPERDGALEPAGLPAVAAAHGERQPFQLGAAGRAAWSLHVPGAATGPLAVAVQHQDVPAGPGHVQVVIAEVGPAGRAQLLTGQVGQG